MRWSLLGVVRWIGLLGVAAVVAAVAVAKLAPEPAKTRLETPGGFAVVNGFIIHPGPDDPAFLDTRSGAVRSFAIPHGDRVDYASCSPWEDPNGGFQLVGRWSHQEGEGRSQHGEEFGLARYALPEGRVMNRVPLDVVPVSYPCWFPGRSARVLFAAGDGGLYRVDFEEADGTEPASGEPAVRRVDWRCPAPGAVAAVKDPFWPRDPRLGGRLLASVEYHDPASPSRTASKLWWLALSDDGLSVVAGGPLAGDPGPDEFDPRFPVVDAVPGRPLTLAYLDQVRDDRLWGLRLAELELDPKTGAPSVVKSSVRLLTGDHLLTPPVFSADGRSVHGILHDHGINARIARFPADPPANVASNHHDAPRG